MKTVIVSPKFKIHLPLELCRQLRIQPGQKLNACIRGGHIELSPAQAMADSRGFLSGLDTQIKCEIDRV